MAGVDCEEGTEELKCMFVLAAAACSVMFSPPPEPLTMITMRITMRMTMTTAPARRERALKCMFSPIRICMAT